MASSGPSPSPEQWPSLLASHAQPRAPVPTGCIPANIPQETFVATPAKPGGFCRPQTSAGYTPATMASPTTRPPDPPVFPVHRPSFASVVRPTTSFRFPPIQLPARQQGTKDGKPMVAFTASEIQPGIQRLQHSLIAKFSSGRPPIDDVRHHLSEAWGIADKSTIGAMDARHILIILPTADESNRILAHPLRKVCQSLFRLFRWTSDFHRRKEPTTITTWIKLPGLPSHLFDQGYISSIISTFGRFLAIDEKTRMLSNPSFARACMELDLSKPFPGEVWVSFGLDNGFWQPIIYENKLLYCSKCKLHGHELSTCRRNKPVSTAREGVPVTKAAEGVPINSQLTCDQLPNNFQTYESGRSSAQINNRASEWITVQKRKKGKSITFQKTNAEKVTTLPPAPKVAQDMGLHDTSVSVETENPSKEAEICPKQSNVEHDAEEHNEHMPSSVLLALEAVTDKEVEEVHNEAVYISPLGNQTSVLATIKETVSDTPLTRS